MNHFFDARHYQFGTYPQPDNRPPFGTPPLPRRLLAAAVIGLGMLACQPAKADFAADLKGVFQRIGFGLECTLGNLDAQHTVMPTILGGGTKFLAEGDYVDPYTCQVVKRNR